MTLGGLGGPRSSHIFLMSFIYSKLIVWTVLCLGQSAQYYGLNCMGNVLWRGWDITPHIIYATFQLESIFHIVNTALK